MSERAKDQRTGADRVWICRDDLGHLHAFATRPPNTKAVEYMRVLSRDEVEKLANDAEGVDALQWINSLQRTVEGQRKHIGKLQDRKSEMLQAVVVVLEADVESCLECNYGKGATGKGSEGEPCENCAGAREALRLVREALA